MRRTIGRVGVLLAAVLALGGLAAGPASAAGDGTVTPADLGFTCSFDLELGSGVEVDICLERVYAPGLQVRSIVWLNNYSSTAIQAQFTSSVDGVGTTLCPLQTLSAGATRACQSNLYWDFDGPDDQAHSTITWRKIGTSGFTVDNAWSPEG